MSDPILLFLVADAMALLLLGLGTRTLPASGGGFVATGLSGLALLLCLPPILLGLAPTALTIPAGPPGMALHLALDPLSDVFLLIALLAATATAAYQASNASLPAATPLCVAGVIIALLAADAVVLALGLAIMGAATGQGGRLRILIPVLPLIAVCLLAPPGQPPLFEAVRSAAPDSGRIAASVVLTVVAAITLVWRHGAERSWTRDALAAGSVLPAALYLLLRVAADLAGAPGGWGFLPMLAGGALAVFHGWRGGLEQDIGSIAASMALRQGGVAFAGAGIALLACAADLPGSALFALHAAILGTVGGAWAGTLTILAAHAIASGAGSDRLSRLGGLIRLMPVTSAALAAGVLALSALPPSLGFAGLWLLLQAVLTAPRTGGLLAQVPLALTAACLVLSAALATAGSVRLIGVALLGQPRTPRGSSATETRSPVLAILAGVALLAGLVPAIVPGLLAAPAIRTLAGPPAAATAWMSASGVMPGYLPIPLLALVALIAGAAVLARRGQQATAKPAGLWTGGMAPPQGLPFGDPAAQSTGAGFLPDLPPPRIPAFPQPPALPNLPSAATGLWLLLGLFALLLLAVAVTG